MNRHFRTFFSNDIRQSVTARAEKLKVMNWLLTFFIAFLKTAAPSASVNTPLLISSSVFIILGSVKSHCENFSAQRNMDFMEVLIFRIII